MNAWTEYASRWTYWNQRRITLMRKAVLKTIKPDERVELSDLQAFARWRRNQIDDLQQHNAAAREKKKP